MSAPDDIGAILGAALSAPGHREYKLVVDDGRVVELVGANAPAAAPMRADDDYMSMREAAKRLDRGYYWLSKNWRRMGLHPVDYGRPYRFERREIEAYIRNHRVVLRGRPRKRRDVEGQQS